MILLLAFLIYALLVHPLEEPLGLRMQCTRRFFHSRYDDDRRALGESAAREKYCSAREGARRESPRADVCANGHRRSPLSFLVNCPSVLPAAAATAAVVLLLLVLVSLS